MTLRAVNGFVNIIILEGNKAIINHVAGTEASKRTARGFISRYETQLKQLGGLDGFDKKAIFDACRKRKNVEGIASAILDYEVEHYGVERRK